MRSIYLSSAFERHGEMDRIGATLEKKGHRITSRWHTAEWIRLCGENALFTDSVFAHVDLADISYADTMIIFTEPIGAIGPVRGGRHVEFGMAIERRMNIIRVGPAENVFHHMPIFEKVFSTEEEMFAWI